MPTNNNKKIEITKEQAEEVLGENCIERMRIGELTVHCNNCGQVGPITDKTTNRYLLNNLYDVILEGTCDKCNARIARYFESGENEKSKKIAEKIWRESE